MELILFSLIVLISSIIILCYLCIVLFFLRSQEELIIDLIRNRLVISNKTNVKNQEQINNPVEVIGLNALQQNLKADWFYVAASIIGKSHIKDNTECQDNHFIRMLDGVPSWGIAVVCDGAGSAVNSHFGSKFMAQHAIPTNFEEAIKNNQWHLRQSLPSDDEWQKTALEQFKKSFFALKKHADDELKVHLLTLSCTAIVVIFSPYGLLVTHIGDGRAAYCDDNNVWHSILKPHKGEEINMTYFVTSPVWLQNDFFKLTDNNTIPESRVIRDKISAFTLLSDGMERHSFECNIFDETIGKWHDPNRPYPNFFNPLVSTLKKESNSRTSTSDLPEKWERFLKVGNEKIKEEDDDKTMILAIRI